MKKKDPVRGSLRADTTLAPQREPEKEIYVRGLPLCCLASFKESVARQSEEGRRILSFECSCGESWVVTSSLDSRVLEKFVTHAGPRVRGADDGPSAA
ncbi:MAG: hypothetical protein WA990_15000 [Rubrobacteraceae bacterium]